MCIRDRARISLRQGQASWGEDDGKGFRVRVGLGLGSEWNTRPPRAKCHRCMAASRRLVGVRVRIGVRVRARVTARVRFRVKVRARVRFRVRVRG